MNGRLPGSEPSQQIGTLRCPRLAEALFERLPTLDRPCRLDQSIPGRSNRSTSPLISQQSQQCASDLSVKPILAPEKRTSHLLGRHSISGDSADRFSGGRPHGCAIIGEQPEKGRQCGFGILPQRPKLVRSRTLKGGVVALQGVDENRDDGTSLGGIDFGDRRSRRHSDQRVLGFILGERLKSGDGFYCRRPEVSQGRSGSDPDEGVWTLEIGDQSVNHYRM